MRFGRIIVISFLISGGLVAWIYYQKIFGPNVPESLTTNQLFIYPGTSFEELCTNLVDNGFVNNIGSFKFVSTLMKFDKDDRIKPGHYLISPEKSNRQLIQKLRIGDQDEIDVVITDARLPEDLAESVSAQLIFSKDSYLEFLQSDEFKDSYNQTDQGSMSLILPNTYKFFWNTDEKGFFARMKKEYQAFWNESRQKQAEAIGLSPTEVYILASIIQRESNLKSELPKIAGVYLNRLNRNMLLQADPTIVFANRMFDARRILTRDLQIDSPYNTYKNAGLPPAPIGLAAIPSIQAVLDAEKHNYIFFCAKPGINGEHAFAKTLSEHNANARRFHNWLNKQKIMK
jgi:UPF0755 protein